MTRGSGRGAGLCVGAARGDRGASRGLDGKGARTPWMGPLAVPSGGSPAARRRVGRGSGGPFGEGDYGAATDAAVARAGRHALEHSICPAAGAVPPPATCPTARKPSPSKWRPGSQPRSFSLPDGEESLPDSVVRIGHGQGHGHAKRSSRDRPPGPRMEPRWPADSRWARASSRRASLEKRYIETPGGLFDRTRGAGTRDPRAEARRSFRTSEPPQTATWTSQRSIRALDQPQAAVGVASLSVLAPESAQKPVVVAHGSFFAPESPSSTPPQSISRSRWAASIRASFLVLPEQGSVSILRPRSSAQPTTTNLGE